MTAACRHAARAVAQDEGGPFESQPAYDHAELIGRTRARILDAAADPAATGEVADRLRLSPSTVSYHFQILRRAGLVRRTRYVRRVLYQSTRGAG